MVMAAGLATRLRPFSLLTPKPLIPMLGVPILRLNFDDLEAAGIRRAVVNFHHLPGQMQKAARDMAPHRMEVVLSDESKQLLGSAGGLARALKHFDGEPFLYFNAGDLRTLNLRELMDTHVRLRARHGVRMTWAVIERGRPGEIQNEVVLDAAGERITGLGGPKPNALFFVGVAVLEPECLDGISGEEPSQFVPRIFEPAVREGKVGAHVFRGEFFDCGEPAPWRDAHFRIQELLETERCPALWRNRFLEESEQAAPGVWRRKGVTAVAPAPAYLGEMPGAGVALGPGVVLYGPGQPGHLAKGLAYRDLWFQAP